MTKERLQQYPYLVLERESVYSRSQKASTQDMREVYKKQLIEIDRELFELEKAVANLDPLHGLIISERYFAQKPWAEIGEELHYSKRQILRLHKQALDMIDA